jgi:hypothetical protein
MRWRKWVGLLALFGVLLHAAALARHNAIMLATFVGTGTSQTPAADAGLGATDLAQDLAVLCHAPTGSDLATTPANDGSRGSQSCPICAGTVSAFALAAIELPSIAGPQAPAFLAALPQDQRRTVQQRIRPPSRGPPLSA